MPASAIETCEKLKTQTESQPALHQERVLTEVDHLTQHRLEDGSYPDEVLSDLKTNLVTAVKEASIPFAVSGTERKVTDTPAGRKFMWLGKTAVESARTGYNFHFSDAAYRRVDVEVEEAQYLENELEPGTLKVFISPRMSEADAPKQLAEREHLADDDQIRINWLDTDEDGETTGLAMESVLIRDVPLSAWVSMLEDPDNIFGKSIKIEDPDSALSVFAVHRELELDAGRLPEGCISLVEAVLPYVEDEAARESITDQIKLFRGNQDYFNKVAEDKALDWLAFEHELSESLQAGEASYELGRFIIRLQDHWGEEALDVIKSHALGDSHYEMSRRLAVVLENAKRGTIWRHTGIEVGDKRVLDQMDGKSRREFERLQTNLVQTQPGSQNQMAVQADMERFLAGSGIKTGGGCPGGINNMFDENGEIEFNPNNVFGVSKERVSKSERSKWKWKKGHCQVKSCPTRPNQTLIGPCDVCKDCQAKFDLGDDPTK